MIFGVMYGASTMVLYAVLGSLGVPTFYDKLLQVPVLNLSVKAYRPDGASAIAATVRPRRARRRLTPRAGTWRTSVCGRLCSRS